SRDLAGNLSDTFTDSLTFDVLAGLSAPQAFRAGDVFTARLDETARSFDVRIYRPDGGYVRSLTTSTALDNSRRNFEASWDLKNDNGALVGRGPYFCFLSVELDSGQRLTRRVAVVALP